MEKIVGFWYAVLKNQDDTDIKRGFFSRKRAEQDARTMRKIHPDACVAVMEMKEKPIRVCTIKNF